MCRRHAIFDVITLAAAMVETIDNRLNLSHTYEETGDLIIGLRSARRLKDK